MEFLAGLHPQVIHFPIALLSVYILFEIIAAIFPKSNLSKTALIILGLAVISALAAVLTGNQAEEVAELWEEQGAIIPFGAISEHESYATYTLWYFAILLFGRIFLVIRKLHTGKIRYALAVLALLGGFLIYETGEEGGKLVFKHGVGTELLKP